MNEECTQYVFRATLKTRSATHPLRVATCTSNLPTRPTRAEQRANTTRVVDQGAKRVSRHQVGMVLRDPSPTFSTSTASRNANVRTCVGTHLRVVSCARSKRTYRGPKTHVKKVCQLTFVRTTNKSGFFVRIRILVFRGSDQRASCCVFNYCVPLPCCLLGTSGAMNSNCCR